MGRRWLAPRVDTHDGVLSFPLKTWGQFEEFIRTEALDHTQVVWRGQASAEWQLESTLDRQLRVRNLSHVVGVREAHLRRFKYSSRGRRGANPAIITSENDWWALGQHYGLATPLLDWSTSPYVAAYFAFLPVDNGGCRERAVFHVPKHAMERRSRKIAKEWEDQKRYGRPPVVEFIEPMSDENERLVNQGGMFTRAPDGMTLEQWARDNYDDRAPGRWIGRITIPDSQRETVLKSLNRMNINHLSLFPDLGGASAFSNLALQVENY